MKGPAVSKNVLGQAIVLLQFHRTFPQTPHVYASSHLCGRHACNACRRLLRAGVLDWHYAGQPRRYGQRASGARGCAGVQVRGTGERAGPKPPRPHLSHLSQWSLSSATRLQEALKALNSIYQVMQQLYLHPFCTASSTPPFCHYSCHQTCHTLATLVTLLHCPSAGGTESAQHHLPGHAAIRPQVCSAAASLGPRPG